VSREKEPPYHPLKYPVCILKGTWKHFDCR